MDETELVKELSTIMFVTMEPEAQKQALEALQKKYAPGMNTTECELHREAFGICTGCKHDKECQVYVEAHIDVLDIVLAQGSADETN